MDTVNLENPWIFGVTVTIIWVGIGGALEVVFFDGTVLRPVISGIAGGVTFSLLAYYNRQDNSE